MQPQYKGLQKDQISVWENDEKSVMAQVVSGNFKGIRGAFDTPTSVDLAVVHFKINSAVELEIPIDETIFFYVISGELNVNDILAPTLHLAEFSNNSEILNIKASVESKLLIGHAKPLNEDVVFGGPFVMNSEDEIRQAYDDFHSGKMGSWE